MLTDSGKSKGGREHSLGKRINPRVVHKLQMQNGTTIELTQIGRTDELQGLDDLLLKKSAKSTSLYRKVGKKRPDSGQYQKVEAMLRRVGL